MVTTTPLRPVETPTHSVWARGPIAGLIHLHDVTGHGYVITVCGVRLYDVDYADAKFVQCDTCLDIATTPDLPTGYALRPTDGATTTTWTVVSPTGSIASGYTDRAADR